MTHCPECGTLLAAGHCPQQRCPWEPAGGPGDGAPADPLTAMARAAASLHELFLAYVGAGFSEKQALFLVAEVCKDSE